MKRYDVRTWKWNVVVLVVGIMLISFAGCKSKEYMMVPEYHTEYICRTDTFAKMDSVYFKDSVYVYHKGDSVVMSKVTYKDRYHSTYKVKADTIFKTDSVSVPYPCERTLTKNEQRLMSLGRAFIAFLFTISIWVGCIILWYHNKRC